MWILQIKTHHYRISGLNMKVIFKNNGLSYSSIVDQVVHCLDMTTWLEQ